MNLKLTSHCRQKTGCIKMVCSGEGKEILESDSASSIDMPNWTHESDDLTTQSHNLYACFNKLSTRMAAGQIREESHLQGP